MRDLPQRGIFGSVSNPASASYDPRSHQLDRRNSVMDKPKMSFQAAAAMAILGGLAIAPQDSYAGLSIGLPAGRRLGTGPRAQRERIAQPGDKIARKAHRGKLCGPMTPRRTAMLRRFASVTLRG